MKDAHLGNTTKKRVLLVDDEPEIPAGLTRALVGAPYEFISANSGFEALEFLAHNTVDVVVADEKMPGMPGSQLLATIRQLYPRTIRIMLTGHASVDAATRAVDDGRVFRFMQKPCSAVALEACIRNALLFNSFLLPDEQLVMPPETQDSLIASMTERESCSKAPP